MYRSASLSLATIHGKERAIFPVFEQHLLARCILCTAFDTDSLGTFTGEVPRMLTPIEAAKAKCRVALEMTSTRLAVATEGSFGPHPQIPFIPAGHELMVIMDGEDGTVFEESELTFETNFGGAHIHNWDELKAFAQRARFPEHALVLRPTSGRGLKAIKGIRDWGALRIGFDRLIDEAGGASVETDMRAMNNPMRMAQIRRLAERLVQRLSTCCPGCGKPGFGHRSPLIGLPCSVCASPTRSVMLTVTSCQFCQYSSTEPTDRATEDPRYCDLCNP
jgi:hypothetical protein